MTSHVFEDFFRILEIYRNAADWEINSAMETVWKFYIDLHPNDDLA
tara:strand:- start:621 stop:758 length:138 start_codon:yes stop_codon:yes gene_type:complete